MKEHSNAIMFAARRIAETTDAASAALKGPRFMFHEYIDEVANIIDEEINREENKTKVEEVEAKLDGRKRCFRAYVEEQLDTDGVPIEAFSKEEAEQIAEGIISGAMNPCWISRVEEVDEIQI